MAGGRDARGLPGGRRRADRRPRSRGAALGGTAGRALLAVARVPTRLARARRHVAAGGDHLAGDGRGRPSTSPACPPARSGSSGPTTSSSRPAARSARSPACWARPTASARDDPRAVIGIGVNTDWAAADFPPDLAATMTSLREAAGGRPSTRAGCSTPSSSGLEPRVDGAPGGRLRGAGLGGPPGDDRPDRPTRDGRDGDASRCRALGVDQASGALVVADPDDRGRRAQGAGRRDPPRPARPVADGGGCNADGPSGILEEWTVRRRAASAPCPPRPRPSARRGGPGGPGPVRGPLSEVPGPGVQLRLLRARAITTRRRTPPSGRSSPRWRTSAGSRSGRARPTATGASTFRVWLFQIARNVVAERRRRRRRRPEAPLEAAAASPTPVDLEADAARHDEARRGAGARSGGCPATGAGRSSCASSTRCRRPRSPACSGRSEGAVRVLIHRALRSVARDLDDPAAVTGAFAGRDSREVDALVTDRYLDAILAAHARGADRGPAGAPPAAPVRLAADRLARDLPRLHPSFRFEEALAARLAEAAARMRAARRRRRRRDWSSRSLGTRPARRRLGRLRRRPCRRDAARSGLGRPLLIGGALTSAALSIAGAAYVAWRSTGRRPAPWSGPRARSPGRGRSDADQAALVPGPA